MTYLFTNIRLGLYAFQAALAGTVLGLSAYFASIFLPHHYREYTIYSIVVAAVTMLMILVFLTLPHITSPRAEVVLLAILSIMWLTLGSWTVNRSDFIGPDSDCASVGSKRLPTNTDKTISAFEYCNEMRVIEAFSWVLFGVFAIFLVIVANLTSVAVLRGGRPYAWREPMIELPWYGEWPGYSGGPGSMYPTMQMHEGGMIPGGYIPGGVIAQPMGGPISTLPVMQDGGYVVQQQHGYSMVITPGLNGQAPTVQQIPGHVSSV